MLSVGLENTSGPFTLMCGQAFMLKRASVSWCTKTEQKEISFCVQLLALCNPFVSGVPLFCE